MPVKLGLLVAALVLGASFTASSGTTINLPKGPGANLVYAKCQTCHDLQYLVDSKGLVPAQWQSLIASMQDYGLEVSAQEKKQLLQYLTTYLGPNPPPTAAPKEQVAKVDGHDLFKQNCASCHGAKGLGQPGYFPPLAGNPDLSKDRLLPVLVLLNGLNGPIEVKGHQYNGSMPAFNHLSNADIAAVINFVRDTLNADAMKSGLKAITPAVVKEQRKRSMTPDDVHAYRTKIHG